MKKTVKDIDVNEKRVLVRVDFNVPIENNHIEDDIRIEASLPTIRYLIEQGAKVILVSHLGRPHGYVVESLRMNPIANRLSELLGFAVQKLNNCIGPEVENAVKKLQPGQVLMLENIRFHPGEMVNDIHFAQHLASSAEIFVNDGFASLHRLHASTVGVARFLPAVAGLLVEKELMGLHNIRDAIFPPIFILLGGSQLVDKAHFIFDRVEEGHRILLGGVLANTFLRAMGIEVGQSAIEPEAIKLARDIFEPNKTRFELPSDVVITDSKSPRANRKIVSVHHIPPTWAIVDIGPQTIERYSKILHTAKTILWEGPMGRIEDPEYSSGSRILAQKIAHLKEATTIAGGGETLAIIDQVHLSSQFDYLSTGGAAFLTALDNRSLPGIEVLLDKEEDLVRT